MGALKHNGRPHGTLGFSKGALCYLLALLSAQLWLKSQLSVFPGEERTTVPFTPRATAPAPVEPCEPEKGMLYTGTLSVTVSGAKCLPWNSEKAKEVLHGKHIDPDVELQENYCRNPDRDDEGVWCVTDEPPYFDYCDLHYCGEKSA